jgi:hypothetical protein
MLASHWLAVLLVVTAPKMLQHHAGSKLPGKSDLTESQLATIATLRKLEKQKFIEICRDSLIVGCEASTTSK